MATLTDAPQGWYDSRNHSPYYTEEDVKVRQAFRDFVEKEIMPYRDEWDAAGKIPDELYLKAGNVGLLAAAIGWPEDVSPLPRPKNWSMLGSLIAMDELSRCGSGGIVWGLIGGLGIGLGPIYHGGTDEMREKVVKPALRGEVKVCLAVSEAQAGSDLAGLTTTADEQGDFFIINGNKKWITGGKFADFASVAVKLNDGSKGFAAIRLVLVPMKTPGITVREMSCMGAKGSGTAFIEFDDVKVPKENLIGTADLMLRNFVAERVGCVARSRGALTGD